MTETITTNPIDAIDHIADYDNAGFIPLFCKGFHSDHNPTHGYKIAKQPVFPGWNSDDYIPPTNDRIIAWAKAKGWIGWRLPKGIIVLDVEGHKKINVVKSICKKLGVEPGIHITNNGVHFFLRSDRNLAAASTVFTKNGVKVTYRVGGKNYLILAPTNNRSWEIWKDFKDLPLLPNELLPYDRKNIYDVLNCFANVVHEAYTEKHFSGYEDIDVALMAFLIESKLSSEQVHHVFQIIFDDGYNERQTSIMYERTKSLMENGSPVLGAGTFMMKVKEKGLKDIERFLRELQNLQRPIENKEEQQDLLFSLLPWNEIAALDIKVEYLLDKLFPKGAIILLFAPGGLGKTSIMMQIARAIAEGIPFGYLNTLKMPVYYITSTSRTR